MERISITAEEDHAVLVERRITSEPCSLPLKVNGLFHLARGSVALLKLRQEQGELSGQMTSFITVLLYLVQAQVS